MANLGHAYKILQEVSAPILDSLNIDLSQSNLELPLDSNITVPPGNLLEIPEETDHVDWDVCIDTSKELQETEPLLSEGDTSHFPVAAGTSLHGHIRRTSRCMADSMSQCDFYGARNMHYMAHKSTIGETDDNLFHDAHIELQEHMRNPIAFHAKMMGDIMYLNQALRQPDVKESMNAVIKEINGHVENKHWELVS
jgi:hypothetical protein